MKLLELLQEYGDESAIIDKLRNIGLLKSRLLCDGCGEFMGERKAIKADGIMFECSKRSCRRAKSVRSDSFLKMQG